MSTMSRNPVPLRVALLALAALAGSAFPRSAASQQPVEIAGRLLDAGTRAPIAAALVSIPALDLSTLTNANGAFHFVVSPGSHTLEIRHIGYGTRTTEVEARADGTLSLEFHIEPAAIEVAPLEVNVEWRPSYLEQVGFYERRAHGGPRSRFYDPEDIRRGGDPLIVGWRNMSERILNLNRATRFSLCTPQILIDGRRDRIGFMTGLAYHRIGGVEVHDEPHKVPGLEPLIRAGGEDGFCPTVLIWTRQWLTAAELEERRIVLCEPDPGTDRAPLVVEGTVTDALTGLLLPRATVTAWITEPGGRRREKETTADDNGRFRFCDLDPRTDVSIWARFAGLSGELAPVSGEAAPVTAATAPVTARTAPVSRDLVVPIARHGHVAGRVFDLQRGEPVRGAEIGLAAADAAPVPGDRGPSAEAGYTTTSDEHGLFAIPDLIPGDYRLAVSHPDAGVAGDTIPVPSGSTVDVRVELDPRARRRLARSGAADRGGAAASASHGSRFLRTQAGERDARPRTLLHTGADSSPRAHPPHRPPHRGGRPARSLPATDVPPRLAEGEEMLPHVRLSERYSGDRWPRLGLRAGERGRPGGST